MAIVEDDGAPGQQVLMEAAGELAMKVAGAAMRFMVRNGSASASAWTERASEIRCEIAAAGS